MVQTQYTGVRKSAYTRGIADGVHNRPKRDRIAEVLPLSVWQAYCNGWTEGKTARIRADLANVGLK